MKYLSIFLSIVFGVSLYADLTFEKRVEAQRKIEKVYYEKRIWPKENKKPKPPFEEIITEEILKKKVEDYIKKSILLEEIWGRPITGEQLQAEMERMAKNTKDPETLKKLFEALGNDPYLIAETLARQTLADRLIRNWYAFDERFHGDLKKEAENLRKLLTIDNFKNMGGENYHNIRIRKEECLKSAEEICLEDEEFEKIKEEYKKYNDISEVIEDEKNISIKIKFNITENEISAGIIVFDKISFDEWFNNISKSLEIKNFHIINYNFSLPQINEKNLRSIYTDKPDTWKDIFDAPVKNPIAFWTGNEVILIERYSGGPYQKPKAAKYYPLTDTWVKIANVPIDIRIYLGVWTGTQVIVWDSNNVQGLKYDSINDYWISMSATNAPSSRLSASAVWTGEEMVVWGGYDGTNYLNTGGRYNPQIDRWNTTSTTGAPSGRAYHTAIWTGSEMIIWGGGTNTLTNTGGKYNPLTNSWTLTSTINAPSARKAHTAIWTGEEMIVWGGNDGNYTDTGGKYNPTIDTWTPTSTTNAPSARYGHTAVWTGEEMIVWGGHYGSNYLNTGGIYNPSTDSWLETSTINAPSARTNHAAIWTGEEMIIWGSNSNYANGGRYNPLSNSWIIINHSPNPSARVLHTAVFTGDKMIIWGGWVDGDTYLNDGGIYDVSTDNWTYTNLTGAPSNRYAHTAVWTGQEMIIWGGHTTSGVTKTGGRYNPSTNTWTPTSTTNAPSARFYHTAIWSGDQMIIWGGSEGAPINGVNTGAKYEPISNIWSSTSVTNAPSERYYHTAVWTGEEMIVWGGRQTPADYLNTGGRYKPTTDSWIAISTTNAPSARSEHTAIWTGEEMIVWGGVSNNGAFNTGGRYNPATDTWQATSTTNAPSARAYHTAIWTGQEMIVWGGSFLNTGGRYNPITDTWQSTSMTNAPSGRRYHTAIWTGEEMIIWGGEDWNFENSNDGGTFYPNTPPIASFSILTSNGNDNIFTLGINETLTLDGSSSTDGSNPWTTTPYHDKLDSILYQWDLNEDSTTDKNGQIVNLSQFDLESYGIDEPGNYNIWLCVTDEAGEKDCEFATLIVQDGVPPSVNVITPNGGESWAYSENSSNRQNHLIVWSSSDNFEITRTKISYTTDGTQWTCISDSESLDCPANGLAPSATNYLWQMPTKEEAQAQDQTFPSATCKIKVEVWDSSNNYSYDKSDSNFYIIQPTTTAIQTLILWNSQRIEAKYGELAKNSLSLKLLELSDHQKINGVVLDLSSVPAIQNAYTNWDADPTNQTKANSVAGEIRNYILDQINNTYTNARYLILVGDDFQIPFYRIQDGTSIYPESNYPAEVGLNTTTTIGSAINQGYFLTDNFYSELEAETNGTFTIYLNDLYIGRLVETPEQIEGVINSYFAADGQVNIKTDQEKILVTGYDFLYDSALDIKNRFISSSKTTEWLLDDPEVGGDEYTPTQLETELFNETPIHQLTNINTHANHYNFGTSSGNLSTSTMDTNPKKLSRTILYTSGCHSGLPVPPFDTNNLDLPELMAKKEVLAYIGNTGYGWGIRYGKGLTETLMEKITEKFLSKDSIKIGEALGEAKRSYYLEEKRYDVFDEKVLHELTLYGIPNTIIVNSVAGAINKTEELPSPDSKEDKVCVKGICMEKKLWTKDEKGLLPPGVTQLDLNFIFGPETYQKITTPDGDYYTLNGKASGETGDAIQPHFIYNSYLSGTKAHGIIFAGGNYTQETPFNPVIAVPRSTNTDYGEGPLPGLPTWVPGVKVSYGVSSPSTLRGIGQVGYTNMLVHTGYYSNNVESRFQDMQFTIYYSNSEDYTPPSITDPGAGGFHTIQGLEATFNATITDASGVYRAVIIYNDKRTGRWTGFDLQKGSGNNWSGKITLKGNITYYLQAIDNAGNVGIISITGSDLDGNNQPYGSTWSGPKVWEITLTDTDSDELPDAYEEQYYCLNKNLNDSAQDLDYDYLTNLQEFLSDTNPCKGDTDGGGDNDGSEKNNGRDNLNKGDDKHLTIMVTKNGTNYTIEWDDSYGENSLIDGYYFVYRSDTPFFDPADRINPSPIPDGTKSFVDSNPPCSICYYNVWNYQIDTQPPVVEAVVPATGPASGGTSVKVYGENFQQGAKVYFDNVLATNIVFVNESQINCKTPPHASGVVDVKVVNPNGQDGVLTGGFIYQ